MTSRRLLLGLAGVVALAEVGLRWSGPLPSLRSVPQPFEASAYPSVKAIGSEPSGCLEEDTNQPPPIGWRWMAGHGDEEPLRMLIVGDSVTLGRGVNPSDTWAVALAERLSNLRQRRVELFNAAVNASGYCGAFRAVHHHTAHADFDRVVVGLFADDLEQRAVVIEDGGVYANPAVLPGMVGWLATHSHVFNAVWLEILRVALARGEGAVPAEFVGAGRTVPTTVLDNMSKSISLIDQYEPLFILNSPAGMGHCHETSPPADCVWLRADMGQMARMLDESGERWIDNRRLFDGETTGTTLPVEQDWLKTLGRLPVHPNAVGHRMIAESVPDAWLLSSTSHESGD